MARTKATATVPKTAAKKTVPKKTASKAAAATAAKKTPARKTPAKKPAAKKQEAPIEESFAIETLRRLSKKAVGPDGEAVERFGKTTALLLRAEALSSLEKIVSAADSFRNNVGRGTLFGEDVIAALALFGVQFGNGFKSGKQIFPVFHHKDPGMRTDKDGNQVKVKSRASTKMKELQKARESLILNRASVERVTYNILSKLNPGKSVRVSLNAKDVLHVFVESRLLDLIGAAAVIMQPDEKKVFKGKFLEAAISLKPLKLSVASPVADVPLKTYIDKVHKSLNDGTGIDAQGKDQVERVVNIVLSRILSTAASLIKLAPNSTARPKDIYAAVQIVFGQVDNDSLLKKALEVMKTAVDKFTKSEKGSSAVRAGTNFPPTRFTNAIKKQPTKKAASKKSGTIFISNRVSAATGAALAAVLELVTAEILEAAGKATLEDKHQRITSSYIRVAILNDPEIASLFSDTIIGGDMNANAGVANYLKGKKVEEAS